MGYLQKGDEQRKIAETKLNEKSSRSHTVFKVSIQLTEKNLQTSRNKYTSSQINLVDLAGSEGVSKTQSEGVRFREGSNINKSLLALSRVIQMLGLKFNINANNITKGGSQTLTTPFINYRDSKLTRILQQALSGSSMTSIICTMSQLHQNYQESKETLNFGTKAKNIKTIVNVNEVIRDSPEEVAQRMFKVQRENEDLKNKLTAAKEEMLRMFEQKQQEYAALGSMKEHQEYLMKMIDDKNAHIGHIEARNVDLQGQLDEQRKRGQEQLTKIQTLESELMSTKQELIEVSNSRDTYWQDRVEEMFGIISELEKVIQAQTTADEKEEKKVNISQQVRKSARLAKKAMQNVTMGDLSSSMMNPF